MEQSDLAAAVRLLFIAELGGWICSILDNIPVVKFISGIVGVIFLFVSLVALNRAGKELKGCRTAFTLSIIEIVVLLVKWILGVMGSDALSTLIGAVQLLCDMAIIFYICTSIADSVQGRNPDVAKTGQRAWKITFVCQVLAIIASILSLVPAIAGMAMAALIIVICAVLSLVAQILYIIFLNRSSKVLDGQTV